MSDEFIQPPQFESRRESATPVWLLIGAAVAVVVIVGAIVYRTLRKPAPPPAPVATAAPAETPAAAAPAAASAPEEPLPTLDASDPCVRERLAPLSSGAPWARLLAGEGLIRRFAAAVLSIDERKSVRGPFADLAPEGAFRVRESGGRQFVDPASFARFDPWVRVVAALDPEATAAAWRRLKPLAEGAWREIAPPERTLDQGVGDAIDHLLAAPLAPDEIEVIPHGVVYAYADRTLESLSPAQKLLVRTGRANQATLRGWLEAFRARL